MFKIPSEGNIQDPLTPSFPGLVHVILLVAKKCILLHWLLPSTPDMPMVIEQLKSYLIAVKLYTEHIAENGVKSFFSEMDGFYSTPFV